ncbi:MAG: hypothetical protein DWQ36_18995 [Acidobacteria bacterium]|nr:MAG: hypothetical protein DWQ36_18995 [Acidobacteriota bacterium]
MKRPHQRRRLAPVTVTLCAALLLALVGPASAAESHNFTASLFGTVGGPLDVSGDDPGLGQTGFQLGFAWLTQPKTQVGVRVGQVTMDGEQLEGLFDPELLYATIGGEYRYRETYYESGVFLGLGVYSLEGIAGGASVDDSSLGINLGVTGDFPLTRKLSFLAEVSVHSADLDYAQLFAFAHLGLAYHF